MKTITALLLAVSCLICLALPAQTALSESAFEDVPPGTPQAQAIAALVDAGCIQPLAPNRFGPDEPITAQDYVKMICMQKRVAPTSGSYEGADAGYLQAALDAGWFDWDQIPPDQPGSPSSPISRELGANIVVAAYFGRGVEYDYTAESARISDFAEVSGRYYFGVLGGLAKGVFDHRSGTPFFPRADLTRGDACLWVYNAARVSDGDASPSTAPSTSAPVPTASSRPAAGGVSQNGWLRVEGTRLLNEHGQPVVLTGMSSHGIQWFPQYTNRQSIANTASRSANIFRVAMYVEEGGYMQNPQEMTERVVRAVDNAVALDMYVIIDWHILQDGNPLTHADAAAAFFDSMSTRYADVPNVLYEICNEPNGNITWSGDVKPYAERMTGVIRAHSSRGVILIGSPTWDQDVDQAAADPVSGSNLMYTLHFYAGTHHQALRDKADRALAMGAPLFVSEWGTSAADGSGGVFLDSSEEWMSWMDQRGISWCNWSLCDKDESSAALRPGTSPDIVWTEDALSESGRFVFARFHMQQPAPAVDHVTCSQALAQFGAAGRTAEIMRNGQVLAEDDPVSTGCILIVHGPQGTVLSEHTVIVQGDVLGTGRITIAQLVAVARAVNGSQPLTGPYLAAADFAGSGSQPSIADLVREARLLSDPAALTLKFLPAS
ncbi:MAG: cellulase family glycosylhydrolase [Clostridia bacterium]|nr:cellulase family glycosylhydrolase [Clostridia bacterium]